MTEEVEWTPVGSFGTGLDADIASELLIAAGIPVLIRSDRTGMFWPVFQGSVPGGVGLAVQAAHDQAEGKMTWLTMLKHPSAFLPVAMSLVALATVLIFIALHGTAPQADEGAAAHIWQLLMAAQVPLVVVFVIRWTPQSPRQAAPIPALQIGAAMAAMAPVFLFRW